ncbi:MAG: hypothetical protein HC820_05610 [Hydrococcus sp. RM1_1_31]|nr:hypothetical protein [Hydrococcus sp. RM1_1_31]
MRYLIPGLTAAFLLTATSLGACQSVKKTETTASQMQTSQPSQKTPQTAQNVSTQKKIVNSAPDDWIVTEDEVWIPVVDGLGQHLHSARQSFVNRDNKASASQIREAAAFLKRESGRASSQSKAPIEKAIANLEKLAGEVESGKITSVAQLDPVFVEAYQADSEHIWVMVDEQQWFPVVEKPSQHWRNARENFLKKDNQAAAQEIHKGVAFAFLKLEAHRASEEEKSALSASAQELVDTPVGGAEGFLV